MTFFLTLPEVRFFSISENYNHYDTKTSREFDFGRKAAYIQI